MNASRHLRSACYLLWAILLAHGGLAPDTGLTHPHVFADYSFVAVFDERGLKGVEVRWIFDEMFSADLTSNFDKDKNKRFDGKEIESVRDVAFAELPEVEYFIVARVDGKARPTREIRDFSVRIKNGRLYCSFFVPLMVLTGKRPRSIELTVCDKEYFIDFTLDRRCPVAFSGSHGFRNRVSLNKEARLAYYFGQVTPEVVKINFRKDK